MGSKKVYPPDSIITAGAMTGTTTLLSTLVPISNGDNFSIQIRWTGTPSGTISFAVSNDKVNFDTLVISALGQPVGSAGGYSVSLNQLPFAYLQLQYTNATGTGLLNAVLVGKDLN